MAAARPISALIVPVIRRPQGNKVLAVGLIWAATPAAKMSTVKRGNYTKKQLPEEYIKKLYDEGLGYKNISVRIYTDFGIMCSYRTVARVVNGERNT